VCVCTHQKLGDDDFLGKSASKPERSSADEYFLGRSTSKPEHSSALQGAVEKITGTRLCVCVCHDVQVQHLMDECTR